MQESSLYQLSYRTVMFERRAGLEPAVTCLGVSTRLSHLFGNFGANRRIWERRELLFYKLRPIVRKVDIIGVRTV